MAIQVGNNYNGILYSYLGSNSYLMYASKTNYQGGSSSYREPDVTSSYDGGSSDTVDGKITTTRLTTEYNAMMNWMAKNGKTVGTTNSSNTNNSYITGSQSTDIVNNVYDLYGCHSEWTLEAYDSNSRAIRGGFSGSNYSPATRNRIDPINTNSYISSRASLYVK